MRLITSSQCNLLWFTATHVVQQVWHIMQSAAWSCWIFFTLSADLFSRLRKIASQVAMATELRNITLLTEADATPSTATSTEFGAPH
mmetsp:Transcript_51449/g.85335  ORF Transcript_51449/g.85335 Transcript_51449/m.85335 type:complete len:87 (+) Transcript_51449:905-1165(+)